jgi:tape measure domain-containing protein
MTDDLQVKIRITGDASGLRAAARQGKDALEDAFGQTGASIGETARALRQVEDVAEGAADALEDMGESVGEAASGAKALRDVSASADAAAGSMDRASGSAGSLWGKLVSLSNAFIAAAGFGGGREIVRMADEYGQMASRVKMATDSAEEFLEVQERLAETASATYRPISEAQEMFIRSSDALKSLGYNTQGVLDITGSLSCLLVTNAASGERAASAINAFSKSLQTGKVDAEAWRSLLAAVPSVVEDIAAAAGKSAEEIRKLGASGALELEALTEGLRKSLEANAQAARDMPTTVGDAFTALRNNLQVFIGAVNEAGGYTEKFVKVIEFLAENIRVAVVAAFSAFAAAVAVMLKRLKDVAFEFTKTQVAAARTALAQRQLAQAALAAAAAEAAAARAAVDNARVQQQLAADTAARTLATNELALAEARLAGAETTLAAASAKLTAARGALGLALSGAWRFLAGPWGIALTTAISLLGIFRKDTDAATDSQLDFSRSLEETAEQFRNLSRARQGAEIARADNAAKKARDDYQKTARELAGLARKETSWFRGYSDPDEAALKRIVEDMNAAAHGKEVDFNRVSGAIERLGDVSEETRNKMREKLGDLEKLGGTAETAASAVKTLTNAQAEQAKAKPQSGKPAEDLTRALEKASGAARELGVDLSLFSSKVSPEFEKVTGELDTLIDRFDKLESAGYDTGKILEDAFKKALEKTKNPADLIALTDKVTKLGEEGRLAKPKLGLIQKTEKIVR